MWAPIVPVPDVMKYVSEHFPRQMAGYLRVFFKQEPAPEEFRKVAAAFQIPEEEVIARLDEAGIERTLITGFDEWTSAHETFIPNELVAGLAERHPDRFIPFVDGELQAVHVNRGRRKGLRIQVKPDQPGLFDTTDRSNKQC